MSSPRFQQVLAQLRSVLAAKWDGYKNHFREEVRPQVLDLMQRQAETMMRKARGEDVVTQLIAQAAEQSNLLVEERLILSVGVNEAAMSAVFDVIGELLT